MPLLQTGQRLLWFVLFWIVGVATVAVVGLIIKAALS